MFYIQYIYIEYFDQFYYCVYKQINRQQHLKSLITELLFNTIPFIKTSQLV